jgi:hypothetical protein
MRSTAETRTKPGGILEAMLGLLFKTNGDYMNAQAAGTCYACDQPATTREHAPPSSFFPEGLRDNLITVPSCALHNNANSKDVEYARNVISTMLGVNEVGERHFLDKAIRSFGRTPALLHTTFSDIRPVNIHGMTSGVFTLDVERITNVMAACIRALHFRETGERVYNWQLVFPNLHFASGDATEEEAASWRESLSVFRRLPFSAQATSSPDVFQYAVADIEGHRVYSLLFYRGFAVYAFRTP